MLPALQLGQHGGRWLRPRPPRPDLRAHIEVMPSRGVEAVTGLTTPATLEPIQPFSIQSGSPRLWPLAAETVHIGTVRLRSRHVVPHFEQRHCLVMAVLLTVVSCRTAGLAHEGHRNARRRSFRAFAIGISMEFGNEMTSIHVRSANHNKRRCLCSHGRASTRTELMELSPPMKVRWIYPTIRSARSRN
jgi:hypothetical protein